MTSITATTSATALQQAAAAQRHHPPRQGRGGSDPLDSVTDLLSSTKDELKTALSNGQSLDDIATSKGISHEDLIAALKKGMPADAAQGVQATQVLESLATQKGLPTGPPPPLGGGRDKPESGILTGSLTQTQQKGLDTLASLLGSSSQDLLTQLQSGTDLLELLASKNINASTSSTGVQDGFLLDATA